jgi:hypothetical protein
MSVAGARKRDIPDPADARRLASDLRDCVGMNLVTPTR